MGPCSILSGRVKVRRGSGLYPFSLAPLFESTYNRRRRVIIHAPAARYMVRKFSRILNPLVIHPSRQHMPELGLDMMEGIEFFSLMDDLKTSNKIDADGDVVMTDYTPLSINTSMDNDTSMHFDTAMDIDPPNILPPWAKDTHSTTIPTTSAISPFPPLAIAMPGDHILENINEYTTPIKAPQLKQLVFGLGKLSLTDPRTKRKLEKDADSPEEEAQQPRRKIKKLTKIPSLNYTKPSSVPKANSRVPRPRNLRYKRAVVFHTPSPEPIPLIKVTDPDGNITYPFVSEAE
ncbi:hypothetical protein GL218_05074 [Daldinia childiae]|uniref:uncharacterized protein n=1 Tax=Daldinia childiae TaxID=326645 RepID=UPI0014462289|nr:uncharacterized protein GL218_05074 [Daldinia childiae]KAF3059822.1 hypothetical protein GL218_05074 [Daldinia childiae]